MARLELSLKFHVKRIQKRTCIWRPWVVGVQCHGADNVYFHAAATDPRIHCPHSETSIAIRVGAWKRDLPASKDLLLQHNCTQFKNVLYHQGRIKALVGPKLFLIFLDIKKNWCSIPFILTFVGPFFLIFLICRPPFYHFFAFVSPFIFVGLWHFA